MVQEDPEWKIFFKENPEPAHFQEHVAQIHDLCQHSAIKKQRVVLITVLTTLFFRENWEYFF